MKGVLRFWYRAVALAPLGSWEAVRESEQGLFGSTKGQAKVLLHLREQVKPVVRPAGGAGKGFGHGVGYLGYGLINRERKTTRPYLEPGFTFVLRLVINKKADNTSLALLQKALKAMGLFGGIGSRSRKGFGSLTIRRLRTGDGEWTAPGNIDEYSLVVQRLLTESFEGSEGLPPYTAFSTLSRVCVVHSGDSAEAVLDHIGKEFLRYRSYGHKPKSGGPHQLPWRERAEQLFKSDHDLVADFLRGQRPDRHPQRVVFGLPHNYFFLRSKADINAKNHKRRASPLFIHIHSFNDRSHAAVLTLLPARFLPEGDSIELSAGGTKASVPVNVDYKVIHDFMARFPQSGRVEVWPR